ncbi:MAG TPA: YraN family protein [Acidimicrobiia bacterium]|nr:YraN family protein [Acidimicrobiia bacterium]
MARNVRLGRDEVDLVARHGSRTVAVEVKTRVGAEPVDAFTSDQAARLRRAAAALGAAVRCDLVTVRLEEDGAVVRWIRDVGGA